MRVIFVWICLFSPAILWSQTPQTNFFYQKEIKFQGLSLAYGSFNFHYEKYSSPGKSVNFNAYLFDFLYSGEIRGFGVALGYRDYFTPQLASSYFLEPFIKYQFMEENLIAEKYTFNTNSVGLLLGRKKVHYQRLCVEIYAGPCVNIGFVKEGVKSSRIIQEWNGPIHGIFVRTGFNLGYRFN